jgi:Cys-tRNA(Pro)/Cys-tRNA(Cys) deacylase
MPTCWQAQRRAEWWCLSEACVPSIITKITALLDSQNISYRLLPHSEPVFTVEAAAAQRGVVKEEMVKSILLRDREGRYVMACVTGEAQLDPKAVRALLPAEWKRLSFASAAEIQAVTGSVQGAVAPLGLPDGVPVYFDEAILRCEKVSISSGDPLAGVELNPRDLLRLSGATLATISAGGPARQA